MTARADSAPDAGGETGHRASRDGSAHELEEIHRPGPPLPPEVAQLLVPTVERGPADSASSAEAWAGGAVQALQRAIGRARSREAAWDLLRADALLTRACEAALDCDRPDAALLDLVRRIAEREGPGKEARDRD